MYYEILTASNTSERKAKYLMLLTFSNPVLTYPSSVVPTGSWDPGEETCPRAMDAGMGASELVPFKYSTS